MLPLRTQIGDFIGNELRLHKRSHQHFALPLRTQIGDFIGDELRFASQEGQLFHLPRDNHCEASGGVESANQSSLALWAGVLPAPRQQTTVRPAADVRLRLLPRDAATASDMRLCRTVGATGAVACHQGSVLS